jgi:hypothetical protein
MFFETKVELEGRKCHTYKQTSVSVILKCSHSGLLQPPQFSSAATACCHASCNKGASIQT